MVCLIQIASDSKLMIGKFKLSWDNTDRDRSNCSINVCCSISTLSHSLAFTPEFTVKHDYKGNWMILELCPLWAVLCLIRRFKLYALREWTAICRWYFKDNLIVVFTLFAVYGISCDVCDIWIICFRLLIQRIMCPVWYVIADCFLYWCNLR